MPITFLCPQGHRLTCPDELAGKPGKCPKCGVVVRIPAGSPPPAGADGEESRIESAGEGMTANDLGADQIIFLCPNGHRLHGPASLSGRPGQCPHCGTRFLVPSPDEEDEEEEPGGDFIEQEQENFPLNDIVIQIDTSAKGGSSKGGKSGLTSSSSVSSSTHPAAVLLSQLWRYKDQGASLEIHLGDGKLLEPDRFSAKDANHAIFASQEAGGNYTITAVAWTAIERIVVRGLEQLPKEWF